MRWSRLPFVLLCLAHLSQIFVATNVSANPALDVINRARHANKLPLLKPDSLLNKAAAGHSDYMAHHNISGHKEKVNQPKFSGISCSDRVARAGYLSRFCVENLSMGQDDWVGSANDLMGSIYHRFGFLDFSVDEIGMSHSYAGHTSDKKTHYFSYVMGSSVLRHMCSGEPHSWGHKGMCRNLHHTVTPEQYVRQHNVLAKQSSERVVYPWPGQSDVNPAFINIEIPDPLPGVALSGQPVSVQFNPVRMKGRSIAVTGFHLTDQANREVVLRPRKDKKSDNQKRFSVFEFAWFPVRALEWGRTYRARLDYTVDNQPDHFEWTFKTQTVPFTLKNKNGTMMIDHPVKVLRLGPGKAYSLILSPELASSRIQRVSVDYKGECKFKIEAFNVVSVRQKGSSIMTITLLDGTQYSIKINTK